MSYVSKKGRKDVRQCLPIPLAVYVIAQSMVVYDVPELEQDGVTPDALQIVQHWIKLLKQDSW